MEANVIALENVLVATDFSEGAEVALKYGVELAKRFDASLRVLRRDARGSVSHAPEGPCCPIA
jgi:nucleotide-binding universal stress UspA family protein